MAHCRKKCISILLTDDCNLRCKYCYCGEERKKDSINVKFVKRAISDFKRKGKTVSLGKLTKTQLQNAYAGCKRQQHWYRSH